MDKVELWVVVHDDGKHKHVRPLTVDDDEGPQYQCNMYERIVLLREV